MRLSRKLAGLMLAGGIVFAGAAATVPASATAPAPYYQIMTLGGVGPVFLCLQGDLSGSLGSAVTQHYCDPTLTNRAQQWLPVGQGGDVYKFANAATGLCLDAYVHGSPSNGAPVILANCFTANTNLRWAWEQFPGQDPFPNIEPIQSRVSGSTGYCLDVPGGQATPGLQLQIWQCNKTLAQSMWIAGPISQSAATPG